VIGHSGSQDKDFLDASLEDEWHEEVDKMDIPNNVGGEMIVEVVGEALWILPEDGERIEERPVCHGGGVGDEVVEAAGCDGGGSFGGFLGNVLGLVMFVELDAVTFNDSQLLMSA
jgi:hypothetical protein